MTAAVLQDRLDKAIANRDALVQRRQQLTELRERTTAALNAVQGRVDELTELVALTAATEAAPNP